ncbi:CopD family protein [Acerihabitans sp. TG2]|uniref:CopD family protein n=1 Tax=Acerihabitans sp. TG2 TaxID=3096008 RepID=UPI002B232491|nr:CopD family protein [Acerihabitans sp. TG2]MEA9389578.1 CopD family protein [Acerihabitans sp. TG2]
MTYMLIKSLHIVAMAIWVGGMLMLAVTMTAWKQMAQADVPVGLRIFSAVQRWNQTVTLPAMILTWITGLTLTMMGNWPPSTALIIKFLFVLALSALHGIQSGSFRRSLGQSQLAAPAILRYAAAFTLLALVACVWLIEL